MLPPRAPLPQRRRLWLRAVRVSSGEGGGGGGLARSVPEALGQEEQGEKGEEEVAEALELRWPPWEGLAERYKLIGATSLAFVICNMDKVSFLLHTTLDGAVHGIAGLQLAKYCVAVRPK